MSKAAVVAVTPKPGTKFYHGHGHHHFGPGRVIHLAPDVAKRLIEDGLVEAHASAPGVDETATAEAAA